MNNDRKDNDFNWLKFFIGILVVAGVIAAAGFLYFIITLPDTL